MIPQGRRGSLPTDRVPIPQDLHGRVTFEMLQPEIVPFRFKISCPLKIVYRQIYF